MRSVLRFAGLVAVVVLLGACTALPTATVPVPTEAPAATQAPGSTEAAPAPDPNATAAPAMPPARDEPRPTATLDPAASAVAYDTPAPTVEPAATTVPEPTLPPAPTALPIACTPGTLTPEQTEGPYYKTNPPESSDLLRPGMGGTKLTITGYVLDAQCRPVPGARVDFWQADSEGQYDNQGYTLRGYQVTDAEGRYTVETVAPGLYPGRTRHIHVKITPPNGPTLTTQLYFPDEPANARDNIFSPQLIMEVQKNADGETGTFNFVVQAQ